MFIITPGLQKAATGFKLRFGAGLNKLKPLLGGAPTGPMLPAVPAKPLPVAMPIHPTFGISPAHHAAPLARAEAAAYNAYNAAYTRMATQPPPRGMQWPHQYWAAQPRGYAPMSEGPRHPINAPPAVPGNAGPGPAAFAAHVNAASSTLGPPTPDFVNKLPTQTGWSRPPVLYAPHPLDLPEEARLWRSWRGVQELPASLMAQPIARHTQEYVVPANVIAPYYANHPGGYQGALTHAAWAQLGRAPAGFHALPPAAALNRPVHVTWRPATAYNGLASSALHDSLGAAVVPPSVEMYTPQLNPLDYHDPVSQNILAHELTHITQGPVGKGPPPIYRPRIPQIQSNQHTVDYMYHPMEIDARLAEIKRHYIYNNPGKTVSNPAEAQEAWDWYKAHGHETTPNGVLPVRDIPLYESAPPWEADHRRRFFERMPQLVQDDQNMPDTSKIAAARTGMTPPALAPAEAGISGGFPNTGGRRRITLHAPTAATTAADIHWIGRGLHATMPAGILGRPASLFHGGGGIIGKPNLLDSPLQVFPHVGVPPVTEPMVPQMPAAKLAQFTR